MADSGMCVMLLIVTVFSGSLTMLSELVRGAFLIAIELYTRWLLFAIHRGRLSRFEFGTGKIEQLVWVVIGCCLVFGAACLTCLMPRPSRR